MYSTKNNYNESLKLRNSFPGAFDDLHIIKFFIVQDKRIKRWEFFIRNYQSFTSGAFCI